MTSSTLKQQEFEAGSILRIYITHCLWKKNSMFNISRSTHSKYPIFGIHMDILTNIQLSGKNLQLKPLGKKYSDLIEELAPKTMSSSMIYSYSNHNFFRRYFFPWPDSDAIWSRLMVELTIKWQIFSSVL